MPSSASASSARGPPSSARTSCCCWSTRARRRRRSTTTIARSSRGCPRGLPRVVVHNKTRSRRHRAARTCSRNGTRAATCGCAPRRATGVDAAGTRGARRSSARARRPRTPTSRARGTSPRCAMPRRTWRVPRDHVAAAPPPIELFAEELREAQNALASITGEFTRRRSAGRHLRPVLHRQVRLVNLGAEWRIGWRPQ